MKNVTIADLQLYLKERYKSPEMTNSLFMKLVEEIGEVAEAINKKDGRKFDDGLSSLAEELVDVVHYAVAIAGVNDIDLATAIIDKDKRASVKYQHSTNLEAYLSAKEKEL